MPTQNLLRLLLLLVDDKDGVDNSLFQIWELRFGQKAKFFARLSAKGLVKILKLKLRQDFEVCSFFAADPWLRL